MGLSATPKRHYDEEGTSRLFDYFRGEVFEYSLSQAIKDKWLCEYEYFPSYAEFTNDEMNIYHELTRKIAAKLGNKKYSTMTDEDDRNDPANKRADLISNAENKLLEFRKLCDSRNWIFNKTLIYCTSNPSPRDYSDSTQLDKVNKILTDKHVAVTSVTFKNPTTDRLEILNNLDIGHYDCITAVRCLDEGIDIPSIDTAIILASLVILNSSFREEVVF